MLAMKVIRLGVCDALGRNINYLRVSVTDRCNFRCSYCMPQENISWLPHKEVLCYEEILRIIRASVHLGVSKIRITGGEPLVRRDLVPFIAKVAQVPGIQDLAMTTNGSLLAEYAHDLKRAGLRRVNISLDTLRPDRFMKLANCDALEKVLSGIEIAAQAGLAPIKINVVVMREINTDELAEFARMTLNKEYHIRFIEYMPFQSSLSGKNLLVSLDEMKQILADNGLDTLIPQEIGDGPAQNYKIPHAKGIIGFITPVTQHFCSQCNRIRLTADGRIKPCLLSNTEFDVKSLLRTGVSDADLVEFLRQTIWTKPPHHQLDTQPILERGMSKIGG